jgi:hypothetical protein
MEKIALKVSGPGPLAFAMMERGVLDADTRPVSPTKNND